MSADGAKHNLLCHTRRLTTPSTREPTSAKPNRLPRRYRTGRRDRPRGPAKGKRTQELQVPGIQGAQEFWEEKGGQPGESIKPQQGRGCDTRGSASVQKALQTSQPCGERDANLVPGTLPPRARVEFTVKNLDLSNALKSSKTERMIKLSVCIKGECAEEVLAAGDYKLDEFRVRRLVIAGDTELRVEARVAQRPRKGTVPNNHGPSHKCGDAYSRKCRWLKKPGSHAIMWLKFDLDLATAGHVGWATYDTKPQHKTKKLSRTLKGLNESRVTLKASYTGSGSRRRRR